MSELARKPMYAQMNVGLEPTDISELFELLGGGPHSAWDYRGANGMLQVHHLASLDRLPSYTNTPTAEMVEMWTEVRAGMDKRGCTHFPLVVLKTIDGFEEQQSYSSVPISVVTIRGAQELRVQKEVMLCVDRSLGSRPNDNEVAKNLKYEALSSFLLTIEILIYFSNTATSTNVYEPTQRTNFECVPQCELATKGFSSRRARP
ncbi:hypothetical protein D9619_012640 [Psilocybe cf. subviscida]|uniref:DUF8205 domain-containing protein n=1 Tax=Psilocybe cf. subviscida TaxID=2480587 RepID=A0A8H5B6Y4_9AGAR|nr:hypothetical protein D9619_012640 [Psilocybe cf. subviscida]